MGLAFGLSKVKSYIASRKNEGYFTALWDVSLSSILYRHGRFSFYPHPGVGEKIVRSSVTILVSAAAASHINN